MICGKDSAKSAEQSRTTKAERRAQRELELASQQTALPDNRRRRKRVHIHIS
jgi:hypothetical protein